MYISVSLPLLLILGALASVGLLGLLMPVQTKLLTLARLGGPAGGQ